MFADPHWRKRLWADIEQPWDIVVIGGGITGAGILREAARAGLRVLLVEQGDFAAGTSCASSKLIHGGLRYLAAGEWQLTLESVREREALLKAAPGLVQPLPFLLPMYRGIRPGRLVMGAALGLYDLMARRRSSFFLPPRRAAWRMPYLRDEGCRGAFLYQDAVTDDARLVLRVLSEALADGAAAANYCAVESLIKTQGRVTGVRLHDRVLGCSAEVPAGAVINATGPWADELRAGVQGEARLRPLRGSHFLFPFHRLPLGQAFTLFHPQDHRPLFAFPWQGASLVGTTDLDHHQPPDTPVRMHPAEADYLIEALAHYFPTLGLTAADAVSSYAGVRPVVRSGAASPSMESRETALWSEAGLLTVTGGKLTTYRHTALKALAMLASRFPALQRLDAAAPILTRAGDDQLAGRHGRWCAELREQMPTEENRPVAGTDVTWAELRWCLRRE
ncbi:MAG: glycerol-3-phosphate dehydrogenase/oxidase, partial [Salinisphaera sp.]|nr:glycerol-3-phosphate dehydrogenase/oxidase [Salinisphaera sp.]